MAVSQETRDKLEQYLGKEQPKKEEVKTIKKESTKMVGKKKLIVEDGRQLLI